MSAKTLCSTTCRIAAEKIVFSAIEQRKKSAGELLSCVRSVNCMKFPHDDFGEGIHTAASEPWFYDTAYNVVKHHHAIPVRDVLGVCFIGKLAEGGQQRSIEEVHDKHVLHCSNCGAVIVREWNCGKCDNIVQCKCKCGGKFPHNSA